MKKAQRIFMVIGIAALLVFLCAWLSIGAALLGGDTDPDRLLPAAYVMAGAFIVLVPCMLFRIYVKFDRKYRSEIKSNPTEETK